MGRYIRKQKIFYDELSGYENMAIEVGRKRIREIKRRKNIFYNLQRIFIGNKNSKSILVGQLADIIRRERTDLDTKEIKRGINNKINEFAR